MGGKFKELFIVKRLKLVTGFEISNGKIFDMPHFYFPFN
jgi:hypothetical protein